MDVLGNKNNKIPIRKSEYYSSKTLMISANLYSDVKNTITDQCVRNKNHKICFTTGMSPILINTENKEGEL
jgi:hypothetical protein